ASRWPMDSFSATRGGRLMRVGLIVEALGKRLRHSMPLSTSVTLASGTVTNRSWAQSRIPSFDARRMVEDVADGDDVHLPSQAFMRGVEAHGPPIAAGPGMKIDAIVGTHLGGVLQLGQRHEEPAGAVKQDEVLVAVEGVCVEEEPLAAGQDGRIEIDGA